MASLMRPLAPVAVVLWISLCGCTMCQSPYDYCSATVGPDGNPCFCDFGARVNSAFAAPRGAEHVPHGPTEAHASREPARDNVGESVDGFSGLEDAVRDGLADGGAAADDAPFTTAEVFDDDVVR